MPVTSPFKFLDAYGKEDKDIFFGREDEVESLYELVFQSNLTLVYGQSGTGKTSLVQCGLANRFSTADWFDIHIRRDEDINTSLLRMIDSYEIKEAQSGFLRDRLMKKRQQVQRTKTATEAYENEIIHKLRLLYKHYLKPIYLVFDQFEELFILGNKVEQEKFYANIADILETEAYCRVIIIMREESIAKLYDFEKVVPFLFEKRLRVEPMSRLKASEVISYTTAKYEIALENENLPSQMIDLLSEGQGRVELTYLQVFLDQLYQEAAQKGEEQITFTADLIQRIGGIKDILGDFLNRQITDLQLTSKQQFPDVPALAVRNILNAFVTLEGTKRPRKKENLQVAQLSDQQINFIIDQLEKRRILRNDNNSYEISHDALALHVANARSTDEVALLQIAKIVKDRFNVYEATRTLLNNNELQLINSFRKRLEEERSLNREEWNFVRRSASINRRRRILLAMTVLGIITSLTVLTVFWNRQSIIARDNADLAEQRLLEIQQAQEQQKAANYDKYLNEGIARMASVRYSEAMQAFQTALDFDSTRQEARDSLLSSRNKLGIEARFTQLIAEGDALFNRNDNTLYVDALRKYKEAQALNFDPSLVKSKVDVTTGKLAVAFEEFKANGDAFFRAGGKRGFEMALRNFRQAERIRPNDSGIQKRIIDTRAKLN